jgi:hypothetical protein
LVAAALDIFGGEIGDVTETDEKEKLI